MKKSRKLPITPNSRIKAALRMLSLRCRERQEAMKRAVYTCQHCGVKRTTAKGREVKVEAHHKDGVCNWQEIYEAVRKNLLPPPEQWEILCEKCHQSETDKQTLAREGKATQ
jgi:5-methylcytosine-specific restriction endonuclease McrA